MNTGRLPRNVLFNFLLQAWLAMINFFMIPFLVRSLGGEQYGIFSLGVFLSMSFLFLDLGVGQALVKFLSEGLGRGEKESLMPLCQTGLTIAIISGVAGLLLMGMLSPLLAFHALNIDATLRWTAFWVLEISALGFFLSLLWNTLSAIPKGFQRFDVVLCVQGGMLTLQAILLAGGALLKIPLWSLAFISALSGCVAVIGFGYSAHRFLPGLRFRLHWDSPSGIKLLTFGGWVTAATIVAAVMMQIDKILVGRFLSMTEVGYFIIIFNITKQLPMITGTVAQALFPALSSLVASDRKQDLYDLFQRSNRVGLIPLFAVMLPLAIFGKPLLGAWINPQFAATVFAPFLLLLLGFAINSWATFYGSLAFATNQPHTFAIASFINAVLYIGLCLWLIPAEGMVGAGIAFAFSQVTVVSAWVIYLHSSVFERPIWGMIIHAGGRLTLVGIPFYLILRQLVPLVTGWSILPLMVIVLLSVVLFCLLSFFAVLDTTDRQKIRLAFGL